MTPEERYNRDPLFHSLVDMLENTIAELQLSPTEIREAAMLACIRFETHHVRDVFVRREWKQ